MKVVVYVDGGCWPNPGPGACAAVVGDEHGQVLVEHAKRLERATNNEAEYLGVLLGLRLVRLVGATSVGVCTDSMLVAQQISGWWAINGGEISRLHGLATSRLYDFDEWSIQHVPRERNGRADYLCNELMQHVSKRQPRVKPGIEFRTGEARAGWSGLPRQASDGRAFDTTTA